MTIPVSRRALVSNTALAGAVGFVAVACGSDSAEDPVSPSTSGSSETMVPEDSNSQSGAGSRIPKAEIPVGGGVILAEQQLVLTQPEAGTFKAFSAVCTHKQCLVTQIEDSQIKCTCHSSSYSVSDGSVLGGPAPRSLPEVTIKEREDSVELPAS